MTDLIPAWIDGTLTAVEKLEVHRKGLRHKAVSVFVMDGSKVLIQKRAAGKYHSAGLWANTCCTHPLWGEDSTSCAIRRLDEELGITGISVVHRDTVEYRAEVGNGLIEHEVVDIFIAEKTSGMMLNLNPAEVEATEWVDLYDLAAMTRRHPEKYSAWLKIYLAEHLDRIFAGLMKV